MERRVFRGGVLVLRLLVNLERLSAVELETCNSNVKLFGTRKAITRLAFADSRGHETKVIKFTYGDQPDPMM
ncbi:hypothetical protein K1719_003056 [Acacia pycnantha]|nr:hypothetical protein K1719_003056 [Acacia pycnantha]